MSEKVSNDMAQFVQIGGKLINLDLVTAMYHTTSWEKSCVRVAFGENYLDFHDEQECEFLDGFIAAQQSLADMVNALYHDDSMEMEQDTRFRVEHVCIRPDDYSDLFALGITTEGPDEALTVIFPDGTQRRRDGAYVFLGGSVAYVEGNEVSLAVRSWQQALAPVLFG